MWKNNSFVGPGDLISSLFYHYSSYTYLKARTGGRGYGRLVRDIIGYEARAEKVVSEAERASKLQEAFIEIRF